VFFGFASGSRDKACLVSTRFGFPSYKGKSLIIRQILAEPHVIVLNTMMKLIFSLFIFGLMKKDGKKA